MFINKKTENLKQGTIRAMFDKANGMTDVISMGIGEPDLPTPEAVCNAAAQAMSAGKTHYTPNAGIIELRRAVAEKSYLKDVGYVPDGEIIITNGGMGALSLLMAVILDPGDEVLIQDPQWLNYVGQVEYYGGKPVRVPTCESLNFEMQPAEILKRITPDTKALIINSPNNPTGHIISRSTLQAIADIAIEKDLLVISDEVYNTLLYDDAELLSIAALPGMKERTVVVNSFSKSFAMTGWRIGFAAGPAEIIDRMTKCQENFNACANSIGQWGACYALEHPELSEALRQVFERRRAVLAEELKSIPGISCNIPSGAFYLFPDISSLGMDDREFCDKLLDEQHLVCIPGSAFGDCGAGHIRIAYTNEESMIRKAMGRLREFCKKYSANR